MKSLAVGLARFIVPGVVAPLALVAYRYSSEVRQWAESVPPVLWIVGPGIGIVIGVAVGRMKATLALACLAGASLAFSEGVPEALLMTVVPLVLLWMGVTQDRGVRSRWGGGQLFVFLLVAALVALLVRVPESWAWLLSRSRWTTSVADGPLLAHSASIALLVLVYALNRDPIGKALAWCGFTSFIAAFFLVPLTVAYAACALVIVLGLFENTYRMAYRDDLTGLPARRALNELLHSLSAPYAIAMMDVDRFKKFNDTYGHDAGDQVLKLVAKSIARVEGGGRAFRYGGEEFTVVFPGKLAGEALPFVDSVRARVEDTPFTPRSPGRPLRSSRGKERRGTRGSRKKSVSITISAGVADSDGTAKPEGVLEAADQALYKAKRGGRNRVSSA